MQLIFQLSGEHPELPKAELFAVLEGEEIKYEIFRENRKDRLLILNVKTKNSEFISRLAMTKRVAEFISISDDLNEISKNIYKKIPKSKTFAVRCRSHSIEEELGGMLCKRGLKVDLKNPDVTVVCFLDGKKYITGIEIQLKRDFNERKPQFRPFFHPTSMHPKLARTLVNLARVRKGSTVLDPFCGTGGILIEAGLMQMKIFGSDIDREMVEGCSKNLEFYSLSGRIEICNVNEIGSKFSFVDAIVTDPPYARSSFVTERNLRKFYEEFLSSAAGILKSGKYLVIVLPEEYSIKPKEFEIREKCGSEALPLRHVSERLHDRLSVGRVSDQRSATCLSATFSIRVHKSLTRRVFVLRKK